MDSAQMRAGYASWWGDLIRCDSITLGDEVGDLLSHKLVTLTLAVGANTRGDSGQIFLGPRNSIWSERRHNLWLVEERRHDHECEHFSVETERCLPERLWIANVAFNQLVERL